MNRKNINSFDLILFSTLISMLPSVIVSENKERGRKGQKGSNRKTYERVTDRIPSVNLL